MPATARKQLACVVLGHVAMYLVAIAADRQWAVLVIAALSLSEQALLYIWGVLRTGDWLPRLLVAYGLSVCVWALLIGCTGASLLESLFVGFEVSIALLLIHAVPLGVARFKGYQLQRFGRDDIPGGRPFQVSLRVILLAMAIVACLLAFGTSIDSGVVMKGNQTIGTSAISEFLMFVDLPALLALSLLLAAWATLSPGEPVSRTVAGTTIVAISGAFLPYCLNGDVDACAFWSGLAASPFLAISLSLVPFRTGGYRFVRMSLARRRVSIKYNSSVERLPHQTT